MSMGFWGSRQSGRVVLQYCWLSGAYQTTVGAACSTDIAAAAA